VSDHIQIERRAGDPIGGAADVSEQMGSPCVLVYPRPDFVKAPAGLEQAGVFSGARLDILTIEGSRDACPNCQTAQSAMKAWYVVHKPTGKRFRVLETGCCAKFLWTVEA